MASLSLDGSPTPRKKGAAKFSFQDEDKFEDENTHTLGRVVGLGIDTMYRPNPAANLTFLQQQPGQRDNTTTSRESGVVPLTTSRLANQLPPPPPTTRHSSFKVNPTLSTTLASC